VVVLSAAPPVCVNHRRAFFSGPDTVRPVILVGEAASRPAQDWNLASLKRRHDVVSNAPRIRNRALLADPESIIDAVAEMLGEVPVDIAIDRGFALLGMDY